MSDFLKLNLEKLTAEAYSVDLSIQDLELSFSSPKMAAKFELLQSQTNPTNNWTTIGFILSVPEQFTLKVIDLNGRILEQLDGVREQGMNKIRLNTKDFGVKGLVYYQVQTNAFLATRKMVILR